MSYILHFVILERSLIMGWSEELHDSSERAPSVFGKIIWYLGQEQKSFPSFEIMVIDRFKALFRVFWNYIMKGLSKFTFLIICGMVVVMPHELLRHGIFRLERSSAVSCACFHQSSLQFVFEISTFVDLARKSNHMGDLWRPLFPGIYLNLWMFSKGIKGVAFGEFVKRRLVLRAKHTCLI